MAFTTWLEDELLVLVQAWQDCLNKTKAKSGKTKKTSVQLNECVYARFQELSGGSQRAVSAVVKRKEILRSSYAFIVSFRADRDTNGGVEWFGLSTTDQRVLMKTAGGQHVQPIQERVFLALDEFLGDERAAEEGEEIDAESENSQTEANSSDGDKFEKVIHQKKTAATPKKAKKATATSKKAKQPRESNVTFGQSTLEEESGELFVPKDEAKPKRRRITSPKKNAPSSDVDVNVVLERQSQVLAGFMEKRAEERTEEHERSRQEREADQKFWAAEAAKDRDLLRELILKD